MRSRIATILLRAGNPGWYDSLTNIHLTIARPSAYIYEGMNIVNIKNAINHGLINVIEGSLDSALPTTENPNVGHNEFYVYGEPDILVREEKAIEEIISTETKEVEVIEVVEEIAEVKEEIKEITEEVVETEEVEVEEKPKKKTTKKTTTKKTKKEEK